MKPNMGIIYFLNSVSSWHHINTWKTDGQILSWNKSQGRHSNVYDKIITQLVGQGERQRKKRFYKRKQEEKKR